MTSNLNLKTTMVHGSDDGKGRVGIGYNVATKHTHSVRTLFVILLLVD